MIRVKVVVVIDFEKLLIQYYTIILNEIKRAIYKL